MPPGKHCKSLDDHAACDKVAFGAIIGRTQKVSPSARPGYGKRTVGQPELDPALSFSSLLELFGDLVRGPLGRPLDRRRAVGFSDGLHGTADNQTNGVRRGDQDSGREDQARDMAAVRSDLAVAQLLEAGGCLPVTLDHGHQLSVAGAETD